MFGRVTSRLTGRLLIGSLTRRSIPGGTQHLGRSPVGTDRGSRPVEGGEKPVAGGLDFVTAEPGQFRSHDGVVISEKLEPAAVPVFGHSFRWI